LSRIEPLRVVRVVGEGARLVSQKGALMVYRKWVKAPADVRRAELVVVEDSRGGVLGCGFYDDMGPVALRLIELNGCSFSDAREAVYALIERSLVLRKRLGLVGAESAYRLVHSDGDYLPGLIVDVYSDLAVIQLSSIVWDKLRNIIVEALVDVVGAKHVYEKSVQRTRLDIGLKPYEKLLYGNHTFAYIREGEARFYVDARIGQKTGFFLDQRLNRIEFGKMAGGVVLDLFSYTGGFGIHALLGGAEKAVFVEEDEKAIKILRRNLELNKVSNKAIVVNENVWRVLRRLQEKGEAFDSVSVDPPAFIPHPEAYERGLQAYKKLYSLSARLVSSEGIIVLSSCSAHLPRDRFRDVVSAAFQTAKRNYTPIGDIRSMPPDHPVRPSAPHLAYLKALFAIVY
jgi:23S rRNA (cytosine1962-C5)-methyltransferase